MKSGPKYAKVTRAIFQIKPRKVPYDPEVRGIQPTEKAQEDKMDEFN